jgi:hypothetical protein
MACAVAVYFIFVQVVVAGGLGLLAFVVSSARVARPRRGALVGTALGIGLGGLVGNALWYLGLVAVMVGCRVLSSSHPGVCEGKTEGNTVATWFLVTYGLGLVGGGVAGWRVGTRRFGREGGSKEG